jgi:ribosome-binding factor A
MVTLTAVEVSPDCAHALVYFTCLDAAHATEAAEGLQRAAGFLRSQLAKRIKMYTTPELRFAYDESIARGSRLSQLIDSVSSKNKE